jgi:threonine synthase
VSLQARPLTLLVATSGDTGGAVAAAFHGKPGIEVAILFPEGMVSARQERQLTSLGGNIMALSVAGDFDDCQRLVKEAMADPRLREARRLSSANSINVGRLLPQAAYYMWASLTCQRRHGREPGYIIPSGNLGNSSAALWARRIGGGTHDIVLATNANRSVSAFAGGAAWKAYPTVATLATAMDVGSPSNIARIFHLFGGEQEARGSIRAIRVPDDEIRATIARGVEAWGEVWDPHTATAVAALGRLEPGPWILVATAHPAKFETVVEPLIGRAVPLPDCLADLMSRPSQSRRIEPRLAALVDALG